MSTGMGSPGQEINRASVLEAVSAMSKTACKRGLAYGQRGVDCKRPPCLEEVVSWNGSTR